MNHLLRLRILQFFCPSFGLYPSGWKRSWNPSTQRGGGPGGFETMFTLCPVKKIVVSKQARGF